MELNEQQKRTALTTFWQHRPGVAARVYAAVEAVLAAEQARAAEQPPAWKDCGQGSHIPGLGCADCRDAAQQPAGDVVERMLVAYWGNDFTSFRGKSARRMAAALAVALEGMVPIAEAIEWRDRYDAAVHRVNDLVTRCEGTVSLDAVDQAIRDCIHRQSHFYTVENVVEFVRARLSPKQSERVTVVETEANYIVCLDGEANCSFNIKGYARTDAERYAAGLREELKAGNQ